MTEYYCHELQCACGHKTRAEIPPEAAVSQFGPRVHGAIGYLSAVHKIGRRGSVEILNTLFGLNLSLGTVCNSIDRLNPELETVTEEIRQGLADAPSLHIDETGWKCKGLRHYLWVFVSQLAVYFTLSASRGFKVITSVLGEVYKGMIISNDHSAYSRYHNNGVSHACGVMGASDPQVQGSQGRPEQSGRLPVHNDNRKFPRLDSRKFPHPGQGPEKRSVVSSWKCTSRRVGPSDPRPK